MSDSLEVSAGNIGETGPDGPNQPIYEGYVNESEASAEEQGEQVAEQLEVPDKFIMEDGSVDVDALVKSYAELERGLSNPETAAETSETQQTEPLITEEHTVIYNKELQETGDLSDESYANMEAQGIPRPLVEQYVQGQLALAAQQEAQLLEDVGGAENYGALTEWASENLSESEIDAYDSMVETGDAAQIQMAIAGLHARYQQATGRPTLLQGETGTSGASQAFRSWAEVTEAMKNPKYQTDKSYRQDIENRLSVSNF